MSYLNQARRLLSTPDGEQPAVALSLMSIAESAEAIVKLLAVAYGSCVDCGHPWERHASTLDTSRCGHQLGTGALCKCTEPRPA